MKPSKSDSKSSRDPGPAPSSETIEEVYRKFKNDTGGYTGIGPHADYNKKSPRSSSTAIKMETDYPVPSSSGALPLKKGQLVPPLGSPKRSRQGRGETKTSMEDTLDAFPLQSSPSVTPRLMVNLGKSMDTHDTAASKSGSDQEEDSEEDGSMLSEEDNLSFDEKEMPMNKRIHPFPSGSTDKERLTAKEKNREHARNTRIRKKNYIESLKESIQSMMEEREKVDRERKISFSRLQEQLAVRKRVLQEVLDYRASGVLDANVWNSLLEDTVVFVLPVTPYRSFPPLEVYQGQRYVRGIPAVVLDTSSFSVMLQTIVPPVNFGKKMKTVFVCIYDDAVFQDNTIMCPFEMKTINGSEVGCRCDLSVRGMLKAVFSPYNKLLYLELIFDVMMLMQQIRRASGRSDFLVVPNSPYLAQEQAHEGRVITESMPPYRIVYVSEGWQHLFGFRREQIIGKTCRILQGERTEKDKVEELMEFVKAFLPCNTIITNYNQSGESFPNWIRIFPLYQDGVVSHFLGIMENLNFAKLPTPIQTNNKGRPAASYLEINNNQILGVDHVPVAPPAEASIIKTSRPTQGLSSISLAFRQAQADKQQRSQPPPESTQRSISLVQPTGENFSNPSADAQPSALTRRLYGSIPRLTQNNSNQNQRSQGGDQSYGSSSSAFRNVQAVSPAPSVASSILSNGKTALTPSMTEEFLFAMFKEGDKEGEENSELGGAETSPPVVLNGHHDQSSTQHPSSNDLENMVMSDGEESFDENLLSY